MQFKTSTVLIAAHLLVAATAHEVSVTTIDPSSFGLNITLWTALDDDWSFAVVHGNRSGDGHIAKRTKPLDWLRAHWGSTTPALVDKYNSRQACLGVGARFPGELIRSHVGDACHAIINRVPGATIADGSWTLLNRMGLTDSSAQPAYLQFVFAVLNNDIKPTEQLCESAIEYLLGSACMKDDGSQGALMAIGKSFLVGFNPQDLKEDGL
ncbi:hypothetical protein F4818DRAFT_445453 [Hypoxylon cercidicola]|nr:hypothetical protein F4818DRAFT_445453 [Hypoxylon cercidicola]